MSESKNKYRDFGDHLKKIRQDAEKSIIDVSGAVELTTRQLEDIETGTVRPKKNLVLILASYFNLSNFKTRRLLDLAGYKKEPASTRKKVTVPKFYASLAGVDSQQFLLAIADNFQDNRILYTNGINVNVSKTGVVFEFLQNAIVNGRFNREKIISRVGMCIDDARQLQSTLRIALENLQAQLDKEEKKDKDLS